SCSSRPRCPERRSGRCRRPTEHGQRPQHRCQRATLELAREAGLDVPETRLVKLPDNREVMLIDRFDRQAGPTGLTRRHMVSALTMLGASEMDSPNMRYADIADVIGARAPRDRVQRDREEMFGRMVFNILVGNNDDHLRNHAFLYDAEASGWQLSPLYDVVPATSPSLERDLHLTVGDMGRAARLDNALTSAGQFNLRRPEAARIIDRIHRVVRQWRMTFEAKGVSVRDCDYIESAFLHARHLGMDAVLSAMEA
ncbi:MAG: HipA domain-containing protein, partial [Lysobacter sp.]|nr:HipA domain-containing protein [Lysobacter sp.]